MKTLVIHPEDASTTFLTPIYSRKSYDVVTSCDHRADEFLPEYERIIMMGHGCPSGLFTVGKFPGAFSIGSESVAGLRGKNNVYIWCWAADFVKYHDLKGFATGMFISEVGEADWMGIKATEAEIEHSNRLFAEVMWRHVENPDIKAILREYDGDSPVIKYNRAQMRQL